MKLCCSISFSALIKNLFIQKIRQHFIKFETYLQLNINYLILNRRFLEAHWSHEVYDCTIMQKSIHLLLDSFLNEFKVVHKWTLHYIHRLFNSESMRNGMRDNSPFLNSPHFSCCLWNSIDRTCLFRRVSFNTKNWKTYFLNLKQRKAVDTDENALQYIELYVVGVWAKTTEQHF